MEKERIVIVGFGWVGQANAIGLLSDEYDVSYFDPGAPVRHYEKYDSQYAKLYRLEKVLDKDSRETVYIVCVGDRVSDDGIQDISNIKNALDSLKEAQGTVILRSTVLPKHLRDLDFDFYMPEFLHEKVGVEESIKPHYLVIGRKNKDKKEPSFLSLWCKRSVKSIICTPEEASHIKYLSNLWNSVRVAFVNEFGDLAGDVSNPEAVKSIERIMRFLFDNKMYLRYGKSFGGHCLPKDTRAYCRAGKDDGKNVALLSGALISNEEHRKIENRNPNLKEWFSQWTQPDLSGKVALAALLKSVKRNVSKIFGL